MIKLTMLSPDAALAEIRRLYFKTSKQTIQEDFAKAVDLVKTLPDEETRARAHVYMEGLAEMRKDWTADKTGKRKGSGQKVRGKKKKE